MRSEQYYMLSFDSTHMALAAQRLLQAALPVCVMPTLRAVQAGCGISLRVEDGDVGSLKALLPKLGKEGWRLYLIEGDGSPRVMPIEP